jgi:hypothetical protein
MDFLLYIFLEGLMRVMGLRVQSKRSGAGRLGLRLDMGISSLGLGEGKRRLSGEFGKYTYEFGKCRWLIYIGARCTTSIRAP